MKKIAAIDCGTNSIRLLISKVEEDKFIPIFRNSKVVRLGENIDKTGYFSNEALSRVENALSDYASDMLDNKVSKIMLVATSATRDSSNRELFFDIVDQELSKVTSDFQILVASGKEEAEMSFNGALESFPNNNEDKFLIMDLGGGSTEFIFGDKKLGINFSKSLNFGSVRVYERFLKSDPPTNEEILKASEFIKTYIEKEIPDEHFKTVTKIVGVAGAFTTLGAITLKMKKFDRKKIHLAEFSLEELIDTCNYILTLNLEQKSKIPTIQPGRWDIISGGAVIIKEIVKKITSQNQLKTMVVSKQDILEGISLKIVTN